MEGLRERIEKLSPRQLELLENELGKISTSSGTGNKRLDAYVTDTEKSPEEIRESLKKRLPEYMVPANIFIVEQLPKLPNGKVDFKALRSASQKEEVNESEKAGNQVEYELLEIWKEVLRLERIGINDNFFEIGGDSILSIRIVGLARKKRIVIEPNQLFENQTIAELAAIAKVEESESDVQVEKSQGAFSLTPIQLWFFDEIRTAPHFWHQGLRFELSESVGQEISKEALGQLVQRHDALRSIYKKDENGWTGAIVTEPEIIQTVFDLTDSDPRYLEDEIRLRTDTAVSKIRLDKGPLIQSIFYRLPDKNLLILFTHHLQVDAVSWGIIAAEFSEILDHLSAGSKLKLEPVNSGFSAWADHADRLAGSDGIRQELDFWKKQIQSPTSIPVDFEKSLPIREKDIERLNFSLSVDRTRELNESLPKKVNLRPNEVIAATLIKCLAEWTGKERFSISIERHGRSGGDSSLDLSRAVGWFTAFFPLEFMAKEGEDTFRRLETAKEALRGIPNGGIGYGLLRYRDPDEQIRNALDYSPEVIFNYMGTQSVNISGASSEVTPVQAGLRHPDSERRYLLEVNSFVENDELTVSFGFSRKIHSPDTIRELLNRLERWLIDAIETCGKAGAKSYTPSDFPEAELDQQDLDNLLGELTE